MNEGQHAFGFLQRLGGLPTIRGLPVKAANKHFTVIKTCQRSHPISICDFATSCERVCVVSVCAWARWLAVCCQASRAAAGWRCDLCDCTQRPVRRDASLLLNSLSKPHLLSHLDCNFYCSNIIRIGGWKSRRRQFGVEESVIIVIHIGLKWIVSLPRAWRRLDLRCPLLSRALTVVCRMSMKRELTKGRALVDG